MKLNMVGSVVIWLVASAALAQEVVREFSWAELKKADQLRAGEVQSGDHGGPPDSLKIENPTDQPRTVTVLDLDSPGVTTFHYALDGSVRYEGVEGKSYLEMWNWFADGGMYFSRTLGDSGPMQCLEGSSDWRPFSLPFFSSAKAGAPTRLAVSVVFAGRGTVYLGPVKLLQYRAGAAEKSRQTQASAGWWTARTGNTIGAVGGSIFGLLGGLIGTLGGLGRARRFVLTLTIAMAGLGVVSLVIGVVALAIGQPYAVYFPLMLSGIVLPAVCGGILPALRYGYEQRELRKMAAMDSQ